MEARELIGCIENFIEGKTAEFSNVKQIEMLKEMVQLIKSSAAIMPICENCLHHQLAFCSKMNRNTYAMSCAQWEENSMGLDIIAY